MKARACRSISAIAGALAMALALDAQADLFAVNGGGQNSISSLNSDTGAVLVTIPTPVPALGGPDGLAFDGASLFFTNAFESPNVFTLNPANGAVLNSFARPLGVQFDALGFGSSSFGNTLFALDFNNDEIYLLDPANGAVFTTLAPGVPLVGGLDFNGTTGTVFVTDFGSLPNKIFEIDPGSGAILNQFVAPAGADSLFGLGFDGGRLFVADNFTGVIFELDPANGAVLNMFPAPFGSPTALAGTPAGLADSTAAQAANEVIGGISLTQTQAFSVASVGARPKQVFRQRVGARVRAKSSLGQSGYEMIGSSAGDEELPLGGWFSFGWLRVDNNLSSTAFDSEVFNYVGGADLSLGENLIVGLALGYGSQDTATRFNLGSQEKDTFSVMPYAGYLVNDWLSADILVGYARSLIDQSRALGAIESDLHSDRVFAAGNLNAFYPAGDWFFEASAGLLYAREKFDSFNEFMGATSLFNRSRKVRLGQARVGASAAYHWRGFEPFVSAFYVNDFTSSEVGVGAGQEQPSGDDDEVQLSGGVRYFDEAHGLSLSLEASKVFGRADISSDSVSLTLRLEL